MPSDTRVVVALLVTLAWFVVTQVGSWLFAQNEGGTLPLVDYLLRCTGRSCRSRSSPPSWLRGGALADRHRRGAFAPGADRGGPSPHRPTRPRMVGRTAATISNACGSATSRRRRSSPRTRAGAWRASPLRSAAPTEPERGVLQLIAVAPDIAAVGASGRALRGRCSSDDRRPTAWPPSRPSCGLAIGRGPLPRSPGLRARSDRPSSRLYGRAGDRRLRRRGRGSGRVMERRPGLRLTLPISATSRRA